MNQRKTWPYWLLSLAPMTLMIGPPGTGKTMLAKRLPMIMPSLSLSESLETTRIYSASGKLPAGWKRLVIGVSMRGCLRRRLGRCSASAGQRVRTGR